MCGADPGEPVATAETEESSPRVRSRLDVQPLQRGRHGIISACAEQTTTTTWWAGPPGDHLRVCGADLRLLTPREILEGSSPRVRSGRAYIIVEQGDTGIISACAERTASFR